MNSPLTISPETANDLQPFLGKDRRSRRLPQSEAGRRRASGARKTPEDDRGRSRQTASANDAHGDQERDPDRASQPGRKLARGAPAREAGVAGEAKVEVELDRPCKRRR